MTAAGIGGRNDELGNAKTSRLKFQEHGRPDGDRPGGQSASTLSWPLCQRTSVRY